MAVGKTKPAEAPLLKVIAAGVLAWVLPGLGHVYVGQRNRGIILMVVVAATFWGGVAIGGVQSTIQPQERKAWFMAQVCAGTHTLATYAWGKSRAQSHPREQAGFVAEDVAIIYTGVAGLLNILIILDALASTDPNYVRVFPRMQHPAATEGIPPDRS